MKHRLTIICTASLAILLVFAATAAAEPKLELTLEQTPSEMPRNDEFATYTASVKNAGDEAPKVGDEIKCVGPRPELAWFPLTSGLLPTYEIEWRRDAVKIPGAGGPWSEGDKSSQFYTLTAEDEGQAIQCLIKGTNANGAGLYASLPAQMVSPAPLIPPPGPNERGEESRPQVTDATGKAGSAANAPVGVKRYCHPPLDWNIDVEGTATVTEGSSTLTEVTTAVGTATLTAGSFIANDLQFTSGAFVVGQSLSGEGIPVGTKVSNTTYVNNQMYMSQPATSSGSQTLTAGAKPFAIGQEISGPGIPAGTTIVAISGRTLTLSEDATSSSSGATVVTPGAYSYQWLRNGVPIPGATDDEYQPAAEDDETNLQCEVVGTNSVGSAVVVSQRSGVGAVSQLPTVGANEPFRTVISPAEEPVVLDIELPIGLETRVFRLVSAPGWDCEIAQPDGLVRAGIHCERSDFRGPGEFYPIVEIEATIGADAPDPAITNATVSGGGSEPDSAEAILDWLPATSFAIKAFEANALDALGAEETRAGRHPASAHAEFELSTRVLANGEDGAVEHLRDVKTDLPPGFIGNPRAVPELCASTVRVAADTFAEPKCPRASIVGGITLFTGGGNYANMPIYALEPERGAPAQFAFVIRVNNAVYTLIPRLRPEDGYAISLDAPKAPKAPVLLGATVDICGYGAEVRASINDQLLGGPEFDHCRGTTDPGAYPVPLLTNPVKCAGGAPVTTLNVNSWENPGHEVSQSYAAPPVTECENVPFEPEVTLEPTSRNADSPTGLDVSIEMPSEGLESHDQIAEAHLKRVRVELPEGFTVNPASADGLAACTQAELGMVNGVPDAEPVRCPQASKIGSGTIRTPILEEPLDASVYLAKQGDNPFGSLIGLYLVAESKERGVLVKLAGKVEIAPNGQLVTSFDQNPQAPISSVELRFNSGDRAPLVTPPSCGRYAIASELSPWSAVDPNNPTADERVSSTSTFQVPRGPGGGRCPSGELAPSFSAGLANPLAGATSPFSLRLTREDGTQRMNAVDVALPPGLTGYLRGIPYCPDWALAGISGAQGTGAAEIASPSCPAASRLGSVIVGAGAGPRPFYVSTSSAYLAGPYKGAPLSIAIVAPAVAGPFDLGSVVVRSAAYVNPETAQIVVKSDPIPTTLHGIPLNIRDVRVQIDRPNFILAPTSCEQMAIGAAVGGEQGDRVALQTRFQVGGCAALDFKPRLKMELRGGTKRSAHPKLRAVVTQPPGQAGIRDVSVILPPTQFIDNARIGNVCTRPQFAAEACPKSSILGNAVAYSPLLDQPLRGRIYFRSNGGERELPDMAIDLKGQVPIVLVGFIDSVATKGSEVSRLRNRFAVVPDAPVSRFVLTLKSGKQGLLVNSRDICAKKYRATVKMNAHNGRRHNVRPVIATDCAKKKNRKGKKGRKAKKASKKNQHAPRHGRG